MSPALRTTQVTSYRRFVTTAIIEALKNTFSNSYPREREFQNLKISQKYPLVKLDFPSLVIEFSDKLVTNAGVGHEEWFADPSGILRKWYHRRFEGTLEFNIYALTPLDRDLLADALIETLSFGSLDANLNQFFLRVYGDPTVNFSFATLFNQLMLNTDEIEGAGNNATIAPWQPEDVLVYSTSYSMEIHGGFYNTQITDTWPLVQGASVQPYPQGEVDELGVFQLQPPPADPRPDLVWTNPFTYEDLAEGFNWPAGVAVISGTGSYTPSGGASTPNP